MSRRPQRMSGIEITLNSRCFAAGLSAIPGFDCVNSTTVGGTSGEG
jgi:hypothetical protein